MVNVRHAGWLGALRLYLAAVAAGNLVWEFAQLPLYTIWRDGTAGRIAFAGLHCTAGDVLIAGASLTGALFVCGNARWPAERYATVAAIAVIGGLAYAMLSEWLNTDIRGNWAYADSMPTLPIIGTGLSPLAQWLIVPMAAFWWTRRRIRTAINGKEGFA